MSIPKFPARLKKRGDKLTVKMRDGVHMTYDHKRKQVVVVRPEEQPQLHEACDIVFQPPTLPNNYWFWFITYCEGAFPSARVDNKWI